jgi:hypothetical protein
MSTRLFWRHLAKLIVVVVFLGACLWLLARVIGYDSPWFGLLLMFNLMGVAKVAEPLFVLALPRALRDVGPEVLDDPLYRRLGVRGFGRLLRNTPLRYLNLAVYRAEGQHDFAQVQRLAASAEATHFWAAVLFTPYIAWVAARGLFAAAVVCAVVQVAFNVYPILHLRVVRARLARLARHRAR